MFKNIKYKIFICGLLWFCSNIYIFFLKLSDERVYGMPRADLYDGAFGFIILIISFIGSMSIISYSFTSQTKLSKIGKYLYEVFSKAFLQAIGKK